MTDLKVVPRVDEGLRNSAYLVELGDGRALAVDVSRDLRALRQVAATRGLGVAYAADTHLHADFLTGAVQPARTDGAQIIGSAAGDRQYPHLAVADEDEVTSTACGCVPCPPQVTPASTWRSSCSTAPRRWASSPVGP